MPLAASVPDRARVIGGGHQLRAVPGAEFGEQPPDVGLHCPHAQVQPLGDLARLHRLYEVVVSYQPAGRFWTLQLYELGIYLALAIALAAFCGYWIRARVS